LSYYYYYYQLYAEDKAFSVVLADDDIFTESTVAGKGSGKQQQGCIHGAGTSPTSGLNRKEEGMTRVTNSMQQRLLQAQLMLGGAEDLDLMPITFLLGAATEGWAAGVGYFSMLKRRLMESSFRRASRFAGTERRSIVFMDRALGLKVMATGLDPKLAIANGIGS
jgi:hypothetical protein